MVDNVVVEEEKLVKWEKESKRNWSPSYQLGLFTLGSTNMAITSLI